MSKELLDLICRTEEAVLLLNQWKAMETLNGYRQESGVYLEFYLRYADFIEKAFLIGGLINTASRAGGRSLDVEEFRTWWLSRPSIIASGLTLLKLVGATAMDEEEMPRTLNR